MKIKTTTAFRMLNKVHANKRAAETIDIFHVHRLTKKGTPCVEPTASLATAEQAEERRAYLGRINPGNSYAIIKKDS